MIPLRSVRKCRRTFLAAAARIGPQRVKATAAVTLQARVAAWVFLEGVRSNSPPDPLAAAAGSQDE